MSMMRHWRRLGLDSILRETYSRDIGLSGLSAGCICWFSWGHSDSMAFCQPERWQYIRVRGLGLLGALCCPHFGGDTEGVKREEAFRQMVRKHKDVGIAIENYRAIAIVDDAYRVINSCAAAGAHKLFNRGGQVLASRLE